MTDSAKVATINAVAFDLGNVLIEWNPRHLYRKVFADEAEMEAFLATVCTQGWNEKQDAGRSCQQAIAELTASHPHHHQEIAAFYQRWEEMIPHSVPGTPEILAELAAAGHRLLALSNYSAETFPLAQARFDFWHHFEGLVISGNEGVIKPDPRIFRIMVERYDLEPGRTLFIDDVATNVEAAQACGLKGHHFTDAPGLGQRLREEGLL